jgi:hypothetical protein
VKIIPPAISFVYMSIMPRVEVESCFQETGSNGQTDTEKIADSSKDSILGRQFMEDAAQDWHGPQDTENPRNWSNGKKIYHSSIPILLAFVV